MEVEESIDQTTYSQTQDDQEQWEGKHCFLTKI